jgi:hypothetical protein
MIFVLKSTFSLKDLKILRPKVQKFLRIWVKSFVNIHPAVFNTLATRS